MPHAFRNLSPNERAKTFSPEDEERSDENNELGREVWDRGLAAHHSSSSGPRRPTSSNNDLSQDLSLMPLLNLTVNRICLHEVHRRPDEGPQKKPTYGAGLLHLGTEAMDAFRQRVVAAFKANAQCMEMSIRDFGPGSVVAHGVELLGKRGQNFVAKSQVFADALANAQASRQIPGGLMVVFDGTVGNPATPFFGLMKAELHEGFIKKEDLQAEFVNDLFLSPKTKLYKIGLFIEDGAKIRPALPKGWQPIVYDSAMTASQRDGAATYFYSTFLGLNVPDDAAQQVKRFFEETKEFIRSTKLAEEDKVELFNGLYAYLKLDKGNTVQTSKFGKTYMEDDLADDFLAHMKGKRFPTAAIAKDISELSGMLRWRKLKFPRSITLTGPPDAISELVSIDTVPGEDGKTYTRVMINGELQSQE